VTVGENGFMWKRIGVVAVWILATLGTASITLAAVSRVGGEVTERPAVPVAGADLATTTIQPSTSEVSGITAPVGTAAIEPGAVVESTSTSGAAPAPSNTTSPTTIIASPSTTSPVSTSTTAASYTAPPTYLVGGTVTVQVMGNNVTLIAAVPLSGFTADIEKAGPSKVEVKFKSANHESKFKAEISGGVLDIDTEEHEEDDEHEDDEEDDD
jgi:hypothetical protein